MPDYDPTSIPILNDVIDTDEAEDADLDEQSSQPEATADDITADLFEPELAETEASITLLEESVDSTAISPVSEETRDESSIDAENEPQIGIIDDDSSDDIVITGTDAEEIIPEADILISADDTVPETDEIESSLIEHGAVEEQTATEAAGVEAEPQPAVKKQHASLEAMVEDITRELMPDLEQQLRYLVQQALEDRLPGEVIDQLLDDKKETS